MLNFIIASYRTPFNCLQLSVNQTSSSNFQLLFLHSVPTFSKLCFQIVVYMYNVHVIITFRGSHGKRCRTALVVTAMGGDLGETGGTVPLPQNFTWGMAHASVPPNISKNN